MDPVVQARVLAGVVLAGALGAGVALSGSSARASRERVDALRGRERPPEVAEAQALARDLAFRTDEKYFQAELEADVRSFGIKPIELERLKQPNEYNREIEKPIQLAAGQTFSTTRLRVRATVEPVTFQQHGATVNARHTVVTVTNGSKRPLAYFARIRSAERGDCPVRGARMHNAMALMPGESAEIVVCAGTGPARIEALHTLVVTELGYAYLSKLPPVAVGHDVVTSQAHRPQSSLSPCMLVPAVRIAATLTAGTSRWDDVADFYSRHNCERFQVPDGYRRAAEPVPRLPVTAG